MTRRSRPTIPRKLEGNQGEERTVNEHGKRDCTQRACTRKCDIRGDAREPEGVRGKGEGMELLERKQSETRRPGTKGEP